MKDVTLPIDSRFVAGFVREKRSLSENKQLRNAIETAYGQTVGVACSCGLGRRTPGTATSIAHKSNLVTF